MTVLDHDKIRTHKPQVLGGTAIIETNEGITMLDYVTTRTDQFSVPDDISFDIGYEPTKIDGKKYVYREDTGQYLNVVGNDFTATNHSNFAHTVWSTMKDKLTDNELQDWNIKWSTARNGGFMMMDITLPNVSFDIFTDKHSEKIGQRIIGLHGIDGLCSNTVVYGQISFFCTNKMIRGEHDIVKRKNTSGFSIAAFATQLERSSNDFYEQADMLQNWARISTAYTDVEDLFKKIMNEKQAEKMISLYNQEVSTRGENVYSIYSAFTNYASYADKRNGFKLRNTGNDTQAVSMWNREKEVTKWTSSPQFQSLVAA